MRVVWASCAEQDRVEIFEHVCQDDPAAAVQLDEQIAHGAVRLADHPMLGRAGRVPGTRELVVHPHYRLVYEVRVKEVWILTVVHTARAWPQPGPSTR